VASFILVSYYSSNHISYVIKIIKGLLVAGRRKQLFCRSYYYHIVIVIVTCIYVSYYFCHRSMYVCVLSVILSLLFNVICMRCRGARAHTVRVLAPANVSKARGLIRTLPTPLVRVVGF
jgi:hypothetical protein